jgi:magnesium-dependent phosphatase 1
LYFDDEVRNNEVERLGVTFQTVSSSRMTIKTFEQGLTTWQQRHPGEEKEQN